MNIQLDINSSYNECSQFLISGSILTVLLSLLAYRYIKYDRDTSKWIVHYSNYHDYLFIYLFEMTLSFSEQSASLLQSLLPLPHM
jgi:hypothetical protein